MNYITRSSTQRTWMRLRNIKIDINMARLSEMKTTIVAGFKDQRKRHVISISLVMGNFPVVEPSCAARFPGVLETVRFGARR